MAVPPLRTGHSSVTFDKKSEKKNIVILIRVTSLRAQTNIARIIYRSTTAHETAQRAAAAAEVQKRTKDNSGTVVYDYRRAAVFDARIRENR